MRGSGFQPAEGPEMPLRLRIVDAHAAKAEGRVGLHLCQLHLKLVQHRLRPQPCQPKANRTPQDDTTSIGAHVYTRQGTRVDVGEACADALRMEHLESFLSPPLLATLEI